MKAVQRRMEIFHILEEKQSVEVADLAEKFNVSAMTIRRDLAIFERQGLVTTNYGGAYLNRGNAVEPSFSIKQGQLTDVKVLLARAGAEFVDEGNSVVLDCGSTPLQLTKFISTKHITIITNSWPVVNYISGRVKLFLAPGEYNETSAGVFSKMTIDFYQNFYADVVFMSTQGLDLDFGVSVPDFNDAEVKKAILNSAEKKILLVDHSKFGKKFLAKYADIEDFDVIITDKDCPEETREKLRSRCKELVIAGEL